MQHLLFLVHRIPFPPNKGDKVRSFHMLRHLSKQYRVHLGAFVDDPDDWRYVDEVKPYCGEFHFEPLNTRSATLKSASGLLTGEPLTLPYYRNGNMQRWVDRILRRQPIERALVFSSPMAQYLTSHSELIRVADFVDIDSDKWRQYADSKRWPLSWVYRREAERLLDFETRTTEGFDGTTFVSTIEAQHFREMAPACQAKVRHVNNGVDSAYFDPELAYANPYSEQVVPVVFTGAMDYWPNIDAVNWFADTVLSAVRARIPNAVFYIVGARPTDAVRQLGDRAGIVVTGSVPDIRPYLAHAAVAVAPLRIARGIQNKVLEAMAMAKPVVASPQAAEGIEAECGRDFLVATAPDEYVQTITQLLSGAHPEIASLARQAVLARYDWTRNLSQFEHLLNIPAPRAAKATEAGSLNHAGRVG